MHSRDFEFFARQRALFDEWMKEFDESWHDLEIGESRQRFEKELEKVRNDLHQLEPAPSLLRIENPFVTDVEGNRKLSLRFDCSKFKPEEINVKVADQHLCVHAKHDEVSEGKKIHREFRREYLLPKNVDYKQIKSIMSRDGVLMVEAPAPPSVEAPKEYLVPIEKL